MEDFSFLPTMRSFTRKLGKSILATPSEFSVSNVRVRVRPWKRLVSTPTWQGFAQTTISYCKGADAEKKGGA